MLCRVFPPRRRPLLTNRLRHVSAAALLVLAATAAAVVAAAERDPSKRIALQEQYQSLQPQLTHNQYTRPLYLASAETASTITGDVYAVIDYPFSQVHAALSPPSNWCDVLILHLNTKYCRAAGTNPPLLSVRIGKKNEQQLESAYPVDLTYRIAASEDGYFAIRMHADEGPFDTRDYRLQLEVVPLSDYRSFLHLQYAYSFGLASRLALRAYLSTIAKDKVGFTLTAPQDGGKSAYVGGMRGTVERNAMRYYLAIDAYLSGLAMPPKQQLAHRLQTWFDATQRYPRQLQEIDQADYMRMKHNEIARQQILNPPE